MMARLAARAWSWCCVNLDNAEADASSVPAGHARARTHLHQPGGLESPLACNYGIMVLPNPFLVGKDGKVVSRSGRRSAALEDELKKHGEVRE